MLTEQRYDIILNLVNERKSITATELKEILDTSESTVRRDITALHKAGKLIKVFGGAVALEQAVTALEYTVEQKKNVCQEEKRQIARKAAALIGPGDFVFLDAGTTTGEMIPFITETEATYVTNAVAHAQLMAARGLKVILLGGELKATTEAVVGGIAVQILQNMHFTKGFFGTNGISRSAGFTTPDVNEAHIKSTAMNNCLEKYVLADSTKFHKISSVTFGQLAQAVTITEKRPDGYENVENILVAE